MTGRLTRDEYFRKHNRISLFQEVLEENVNLLV